MRAILVAAVAMAACGGDGVGPDLIGGAHFDIIAGNGQTDTIQARLQPIHIRLLSGQTPVAGAAVSFVLTDPDCGSVFAGFALTDAAGDVAELWDLGTKAKDCTLEARAVDPDGTPRVFTSIAATVEPGRPADGRIAYVLRGGGAQFTETDSIPTRSSTYLKDRHGNAVGWTATPLAAGPFTVGNWLVPTDTVGTMDADVSTRWGVMGTIRLRLCGRLANGRLDIRGSRDDIMPAC